MGLDWIELDWTGLIGLIRLDWIRLDWMDWIDGLDWIGLD